MYYVVAVAMKSPPAPPTRSPRLVPAVVIAVVVILLSTAAATHCRAFSTSPVPPLSSSSRSIPRHSPTRRLLPRAFNVRAAPSSDDAAAVVVGDRIENGRIVAKTTDADILAGRGGRRGMLLRAGTMALLGSHATLAVVAPPEIARAAAAAAEAAANPATRFCGTFSDPVNHPGGTRTISLLDGGGSFVGDYRLASVRGRGGRGEPRDYVLPAVVIGDRAIIIDFSPKGGPRDFTGVLDPKDGSIRFLRDGNRWPRLEE